MRTIVVQVDRKSRVARGGESAESVADRLLGELAIATRRDPQQPHERAPHHVDAAEPGGRGHVLQASICAFGVANRRVLLR